MGEQLLTPAKHFCLLCIVVGGLLGAVLQGCALESGSLVQKESETLDQLVEQYRSYGLPLPPADAPLVRIEFETRRPTQVCSWAEDGSGKLVAERTLYFLGFMLEEGSQERPFMLLLGPFISGLPHTEVNVSRVDPSSVCAEDCERESFEHAVFPVNLHIATAVQCRVRGYDRLAEHLLADSRAFWERGNLAATTRLWFMYWNLLRNQLLMPDSDRKPTAERMRALAEAEPSPDKEWSRALVDSLEAALVPSTAEPGSVEALIDDLVDVVGTPYQWVSDAPGYGPDPRYQRLAELGFDAVPQLIDHLDDRRLTRSALPWDGNFLPCHIEVGHLVCDLLHELSGRELGEEWARIAWGARIDKDEARIWWEEARAIGEERYLCDHAFPTDSEAQWPNQRVLEIIARKYLHHLPDIYRDAVDNRPGIYTHEIVDLISASSLPNRLKTELFLHAAESGDLERRFAALWGLKDSDPKCFVELLLETLNTFPTDTLEPYWLRPENGFAHLVIQTADPRTWEALRRLAKRADVGLRMELMQPMGYWCMGDMQRRQRLEFLAGFLDDTSCRVIDHQAKMDALSARAFEGKAETYPFEGPCAGFHFPRLSARDLAAMTIASILGVPADPDEKWTEKQWADLRANVREALEQEFSR